MLGRQSFAKLSANSALIRNLKSSSQTTNRLPCRSAMAIASLPSNPILIYDLQPSPGSCPYAQRSKIVLQEKGIPHKVELIDPQNKPQDFLDLFRSITSNPNGRGTVPTIIDGNVRLTESHVVSEYLDTAYPQAGPKLFPTDAGLLAKVRLFVELFTSEVQPNFFKVLTAESQEAIDAGKEGATKGLKVLDSFLKTHSLEGGDFLLGPDFSYAEAATIPFVHRFNLTLPHYFDIDPLKIVAENKLDRLEKWMKAGLGRPSIKATLAEDDQLIKGFAKFVKFPKK